MRLNMDMPNDIEAAAERVGHVVDLFTAKGVDGRSRGVHHLIAKLSKNEKGGYLPTTANVLLILANDPPVAGMLGYNEFTHQPLLMRAPPPAEDNNTLAPGPYPRQWQAEDVTLVHAYLQRVWSAKISRQSTEDAMLADAHRLRFHPVREWADGLKWDGHPRINHWLAKAFGAPDDSYHQAVASKVLIAAVRRIRQPGCKFDTLLLLEGLQGIGKSRSCKELFGGSWYSDAMPAKLADKDAAMSLLGVWCLELAEIDHLIRNEVETVKAFLSRGVDRYRPPYGRSFVEYPRQGLMIGTTNSQDYLRDTTGNRRMWPVTCVFADVDWITANREQLWAEAAAREASGEVLWLDDQEAEKTAHEAQRDRMQDDVWSDTIRDWLSGRVETRIGSVLTDALSIPKFQQNKQSQMRAAAVLVELGWKRTLVRRSGRPERVWTKDCE